jgi:hypothetical protein
VLGEPILAQRIAQAAYDRVRKDFTASAARRALNKAYTVIADRFGQVDDGDDDAPKVEMLTDDDFEATVFEDVAAAGAVDTSVNAVRVDPSLADEGPRALDIGSNEIELEAPGDDSSTRSGFGDRAGVERDSVAPPPPPLPDAPPVARDSGAWTRLHPAGPRAPDAWVVASRMSDDSSEHAVDDGTPIEGTSARASSAPVVDTAFVSGEIDVPTPAPEPLVEFTAASNLLGTVPDTADPDTGTHTPPR